MTKADDLGLTDLDQKWVITARPTDGRGPKFTLLWRTTGPRGKPLPAIGAVLGIPGRGQVRIERIDPPGSPIAAKDESVLVIKVTPPR